MNTAKGNKSLCKVVLDTNIIISALFFGGRPRDIFRLIMKKEIIGIVSPYIIFELHDVLRRKKFNIEEEQIEKVEKLIKKRFLVFNPTIHMVLIENNHPDNRILTLACESNAGYLITGDKKHILPLGKIKKTQIVTAEEFLTIYSS